MLDAQRIDLEQVAALLVAEGVQDHADPVVHVDAVALGHRGLDLGRFAVLAIEGEIDVFPVIGHQHDGLFRCRLAEIGLEGDEIVKAGGLLPDRVIQLAVDDRRRVGLVYRNRSGSAAKI